MRTSVNIDHVMCLPTAQIRWVASLVPVSLDISEMVFIVKISTSVKIQRLQHDALRMLNVVIYLRTLLANANQVSRETVKYGVRTSTSVRDQGHVVSTLTVKTLLETILVSVVKVLKVIHMMDVLIWTSAQIQMLAVRVLSVQTSRVVIAATALKVSTEMLAQQDALITTNVPVHLAEEMHSVPMKLVHSGAIVQKDLSVMQ